MEQPRIVFGFPAFQPSFVERFAPVLASLGGVQAALKSVVDRAYDSLDCWQRAILNLGILSGVEMTELLLLAANGCGHGAMKILRSMLETTIDAEYLRLHPEGFAYYLNWSHAEQWKVYESIRDTAPPEYELISAEEVERARAEYAGMPPRTIELRKRRRWCAVNLREEADLAGLGQLYGLLNPLASTLLHGGMYSLMLHFKPSDVHRIDVPPDLKWCQQAVVGGHSCLLQNISTLSAGLQIQPEPSIEALERGFGEAWDRLA